MKVVQIFVKDPILRGYHLKECPFLSNFSSCHIFHYQPQRRHPIGLSTFQSEQMRPPWNCAKRKVDYQSMEDILPMEKSFVTILLSREFYGNFPFHTKITTFFLTMERERQNQEIISFEDHVCV